MSRRTSSHELLQQIQLSAKNPTNSPSISPRQLQQQQQQQQTISVNGVDPSEANVEGLSRSSSKHDDSVDIDSQQCYKDDPQLHRKRPRPSCFVIQVTVIASLGGILFGYDLGIISSALPQLTKSFDLVPKQQELVVSVLYIGGVFGATVGGSMCDLFGRKKSILVCDVIFGCGAIVLYCAQNVMTILIGRVVVGFAVALSGIADVTYLHEIAPIQFRGAIVSANEACIALGFLLAFGIGSVPALSYQTSVGDDMTHERIDGWRIMFGISGAVALLQFVGMIYLPESPKWLNDRGRHEESVIAQHQIQSDPVLYYATTPPPPNEHIRKNSRTLLTIVATDHNRIADASSPVNVPITSNYQSIASPGKSENYDNDTIVSTLHHGPVNRICCYPIYQLFHLGQQFCSFIQTLTSTHLRRQTYITIFLATTQQFCGQTNVLSYAPIILAAASANSSSSTDYSMEAYATVSIGIMKFIVTILVIWKIESVGRRPLLLWGIATISAGLLLLAIAFAGTKVVHEQQIGDDNGGQQQEAKEGETSHTVVKDAYSGFYLAVPGVLLVVCGYSMSYGPLTWLITSELYPTDIRGRALGVSTIVTYACAAIVTYTFLSATAWIGSSVLFSCYLLITCFGFVFAYLAIPDTGGCNPEVINTELDHMVWWQGRQPRNIFNKNFKHTALSPSGNNLSDFVVETEII